MDGLSLSVLAAVLVALALLVAYYFAARRERGSEPHYAREVYFYRGGPEASWARAALPATGAQVALYTAAGGMGPPDEQLGGVWLYGPKPRRRTPYVEPFNDLCWFQPAGP